MICLGAIVQGSTVGLLHVTLCLLHVQIQAGSTSIFPPSSQNQLSQFIISY